MFSLVESLLDEQDIKISTRSLTYCLVQMLETSTQKHSDTLIHEFVVQNLITMYNLLGVSDGKDPSHRLGDWLFQAGPDDLQFP